MSFAKKIKNWLHQPSTPEAIFSMYFNWKNNKDRKALFKVLNSQVDLMEKVAPSGRAHWEDRIQNVLSGPDNKDIPRHEHAGKLIDQKLFMHNGIPVDPLSYYNYPMLKMLIDNKGVHEPQEEKVFQEVIQSLPQQGEKTMLELGAYWSFYSIWFKKLFPQAQSFMVEPNRRNLMYGKRNAKLNQVNGTFVHAGIGKANDLKANVTTVDTICDQYDIKFLDILHSDIQGFELDMLHGAKKMFDQKAVGYIFVSTHSNELHHQCKAFLDLYDFELVASANLDESYSWDGILVMKATDYPGINQVDISKRLSTSS